MTRQVGIYRISHVAMDYHYIGQSTNLENRQRDHRRLLSCGNHVNKGLQYAWDRDGPEAFEFVIVEECPDYKLDIREQYWINQFKNVFNINRVAQGRRFFLRLEEYVEEVEITNLILASENLRLKAEIDLMKISGQMTLNSEDYSRYSNHIIESYKKENERYTALHRQQEQMIGDLRYQIGELNAQVAYSVEKKKSSVRHYLRTMFK